MGWFRDRLLDWFRDRPLDWFRDRFLHQVRLVGHQRSGFALPHIFAGLVIVQQIGEHGKVGVWVKGGGKYR